MCQQAHLSRRKVEQPYVRMRVFLALGDEGDELTIGRHHRGLFVDLFGPGKITRLATSRGYGEKIVHLVAALILHEVEGLPVGRHGQALLDVVRLGQLDGPAPRGIDPPDVVAARQIGADEHAPAISAEHGIANAARHGEIVDGHRTRVRILG